MKEFIYNISILFIGINVLNMLIENGNKLLSSNYLVTYVNHGQMLNMENGNKSLAIIIIIIII